MALMLQRQAFQTSRQLEYFTEKELTLQCGHGPARWAEVVLNQLIDKSLDACESSNILPDVTVTITDTAIIVADNGPGISTDVVRGVIDFTVRVSSKDAYISPTRGQQGNALKTVLAIHAEDESGWPYNSLRDAALKGQLPIVRLNRNWYVDRQDLRALINSRKERLG